MKKTFFLLCGIIIILLIFSCSRNVPHGAEPGVKFGVTDEILVYHTWLSLKEMEYREPLSPKLLNNSAAGLSGKANIPQDFFPWAGITSHHILAHHYLDAWFSQLAQIRNPQRFYIISPDHYGISLEPYSLTIGCWKSGFGIVESDREKVFELAQSLGVELDMGVFAPEHGISALMPYIKKYFPQAKVIAIVHRSEPAVNTFLSGGLAGILENEFDEAGKQENFLIISSDFSHGGNMQETCNYDFNSQRYLKDSRNVSWNSVCCDNRAGIYILDRLGKNNLESCILYHTNSWEISNQGKDDITSYFFVYFADLYTH